MNHHYYISIREDLKKLSIFHRNEVYKLMSIHGLIIPVQNITTEFPVNDKLFTMKDGTKVLIKCMVRRDYLMFIMGLKMFSRRTYKTGKVSGPEEHPCD